MLKQKVIGFIGGGQMCEAILQGALHSGGLNQKNIWVTDVSKERLDTLKARFGVHTELNDAAGEGALRLARHCDILLLALKPQLAHTALPGIAGALKKSQLVISIMGGVRLEALEAYFPKNPVVRVMPNTPMQVGRGTAGIAAGRNAGPDDTTLVEQLFSLVGGVHSLPEKWMDPLTALSGCGPAYAYLFIEALADGGVEQGLPRDLALQLAAETLAGAAEMVLQTGRHPAQLKDSVTSPGGGTIAGVHALEKSAFRGAVMDAVGQSCRRMTDLGK